MYILRGIPRDVANPYHAPGYAYLRNRWTTFCSTTSVEDVASQFGDSVLVAFRSHVEVSFTLKHGVWSDKHGVWSGNYRKSHSPPVFFDIGWISEYPEEGEWLMLPAVFPKVQAHSQRYINGVLTGRYIRDMWEKEGFSLGTRPYSFKPCCPVGLVKLVHMLRAWWRGMHGGCKFLLIVVMVTVMILVVLVVASECGGF